MERLTETGIVYNFSKLDPAEIRWLEKIQNRLAAYEDTGLEPEDVARCAKYKDNHFAYIAKEGMFIARPDLELMVGVGADRWKELALADKGGRLVVLPPFNIGDTIYDIWEALRNGTDEIRSMVVTDIYAHVDKRRRVRFVINGNYFEPDDIGKTVFLTREEAENALRGGNDNG